MEQQQQQTTPFYLQPRYLLMIVIFLICIRYYLKKSRNSQESISDRIWRKFAFSYQDLLNTFDHSERELLKHTYQNTIFNTKQSSIMQKVGERKSIKTSKVQFDLDKNITHTIPYEVREAYYD